MKKIFKLASGLLLVVLTSTLISFVSPADADEFVLVRTQESHGSISYPNLLTITYSNGSSETIELEKIKKNGANSVSNMQKITEVITRLESEGFKLETFSGSGGVYGITYQYYFIK